MGYCHTLCKYPLFHVIIRLTNKLRIMAFKMKGFPTHSTSTMKYTSPMRQTVITDEMRANKDAVEIKFNELLAEEGFSTDTNLEGASAELLALQTNLNELRKPFIEKTTSDIEKAKAEKTGLWSETVNK